MRKTQRDEEHAKPHEVDESGLPGYEIITWSGLLAPAGTPAAIVSRLSAEVVKGMKAPDVVERLSSLGLVPSGISGDRFAQFLKQDMAQWAKLVRESNAKVD